MPDYHNVTKSGTRCKLLSDHFPPVSPGSFHTLGLLKMERILPLRSSQSPVAVTPKDTDRHDREENLRIPVASHRPRTAILQGPSSR